MKINGGENSKNTKATINTKDYHVPSKEFLAAAAIVKGRDKPLKGKRVLADKVFPITAARRKEREKAQEEALKNPQPGQLMPDGTIYLGKYSPTDRDGNSLGKIFNVFAAPRDLPKTMTYAKAIKYISKLKNWHGFDGTNYATDKEIYAALKDGSYNGGWIIPTLDILGGKDLNGKETTPDNLYALKDKFNVTGDPERAFKTVVSGGSDFPGFYWSSTERRDYSFFAHGICFSNGDEIWNPKESLLLNCRPVRLAPVAAPVPARK